MNTFTGGLYGIIGVFVTILVSAGLLYVGITTGVLWTILGGLFSLIGNCIWELLKLIGCAIGSLLANIIVGICEGLDAAAQILWLPALIVGASGFSLSDNLESLFCIGTFCQSD